MNKLFSAVEIEVNSDCNRKCWYCPSGTKIRKERGEMSEELFENLMMQLSEIGFSGRINFNFFGEPLMCSKLDQYIKMTRSYLPNAFLFLASNGDFIDCNRIEELITEGISMLNITQHCGEKSLFTSIYDTLPNEVKEKIYYHSFTDIRLHNRSGIIKQLNRSGMDREPCHLPSELVIITVLGNVLPCCDDFDQKNVMGNIMEQKLVDIWNSEKFNMFRSHLKAGNRHLYDACRYCDHVS